MSVKVLLFGDVGIDDTIALIYGYFKDEVDIVGVVADYGNIPRNRAIRNVRYLSNLFGISEKEVAIIGGAEIPLTGETPEFFPEIHGEYGLGPIIPPKIPDGVIENFFEIINIIKSYQDELIIVNIGRLTSLATMFILYRELMNKVKSYYIMGGAFWVPGNITAVSEANFYADPVAANLVLSHAHNVTIIPLNVTEQAIVTPKMADYIDYVGKAKIIKPMLDYYYNFYKKRNPKAQGSPIHDALALMATIHEDMFGFRNLPVHIVQKDEGVAKGQSIADIRPYVNLKKDKGREHRIAFTLDYPKFYKEFMSVMTGEAF
ncbi:nucleoside hydrolase [Virgibacillus dakarensis]|uniref:Inosine-uridine preferring nucleoside hydrolase n=1 Tax=Lentibacillus populi TaxID=1827502 RepID=A0A9W5X4I6_9BACI|nr:nucleoside hydrolase [Lentibacillus populi]MBT2217891.1 nucleoside hydrolase [Virgibacillus dakarensis]MTW87571.1 nucleoside hydrolase [Virgibacillus dakarensis]GGB35945.1 inosine-uridine preferring nucleoside hydrolase [Lentibacillus populi]